MNTRRKLLRNVILGFLLTTFIFIYSCSKKNENKMDKANLKNKVTEIQKPEEDKIEIKEFIFGYFCAECGWGCAPMFKLIIDKNKFRLVADFEDNYFKSNNSDSLNFKIDLSDNDKIIIAKQIWDKLPKTLQEWDSIEKIFGCPDCKDGCGVYIEFTKNLDVKITKKFYLDLMTSSKNPKEMEDYGLYVYSKALALRGFVDSTMATKN